MKNEPQVIAIDGVPFVFGLFWQPLSSSTRKDRIKEIRGLASELSFDLHVFHESATPCVGFAKLTPRIRPGIPSAAAAVSSVLAERENARDFIFVSRLPDGNWVYIAQREGAILPDGDRIFSSEDAARAFLLEHTSLGDWQLVIAPSIWGIHNSTEMNLVELLPKNRRGKPVVQNRWKLVYLNPARSLLALHGAKIFLVATIASAAIGGHAYYKQWKIKEEAKTAAEIAAKIAAKARNELGQVLPPEHPWKNQPAAADFLAACLDALNGQRLFPGNWDLSEIRCTGGNLTISWRPREGGWIAHLREVIPNAEVSLDGGSAFLTVSLPALATGQDEALFPERDRLIAMQESAQRYGVSFTISANSEAATLPSQEAPSSPKDWKEIVWKADGVLSPWTVLAALDGPGFRLSNMRGSWQNGTIVWSLEGTQYVSP